MKQIHLNENGEQIVWFNEDGEGFTQDQMDAAEARAENEWDAANGK